MAYTPNFVNSNLADKLSDKWLGTNNQSQIDFHNQLEANKSTASMNYEIQKSINENKYQWNIEGMTKAGINPMMMTGNLANTASGTPISNISAAQQNRNSGVLDYFNDIFNYAFDSMNPKKLKEEAKELVKLMF